MTSLDDDLSVNRNAYADSNIIKASAVYNLRHEIERIHAAFLNEAQAKQIDLSIVFTGDIPVVYWDMDSLRSHVFSNILSRSISNTPIGGKIEICVKKLDDYTMLIKISDSGQHISKNEMENIFHNPKIHDHPINNNDVGLKSALLCIEAHKGMLSIVDEPSFTGATFKIEIPSYSLCISDVFP